MEASSYLYATAAFAVLLGCHLITRRRLLPPGPRRLPFVGNAFDFPSSSIWETFTRWKETYGKLDRSCKATHSKKAPLLGDVVYLSLFGQPVLILNTATGTSDLLQKRGANYASRPTLTLRDEL